MSSDHSAGSLPRLGNIQLHGERQVPRPSRVIVRWKKSWRMRSTLGLEFLG